MNSSLSDTELDNLLDDAQLDLEPEPSLPAPPAREPLPQQDLKFFRQDPGQRDTRSGLYRYHVARVNGRGHQ